jgi:hypothetical protein
MHATKSIPLPSPKGHLKEIPLRNHVLEIHYLGCNHMYIPSSIEGYYPMGHIQSSHV